jgi:hypothetical protein
LPQPLLVPFIPSLVEGVSHKKKEVQVAAEQAGHAIIDILCPWAIRVVQSMLFAGAMETKWQVGSKPAHIGPVKASAFQLQNSLRLKFRT